MFETLKHKTTTFKTLIFCKRSYNSQWKVERALVAELITCTKANHPISIESRIGLQLRTKVTKRYTVLSQTCKLSSLSESDEAKLLSKLSLPCARVCTRHAYQNVPKCILRKSRSQRRHCRPARNLGKAGPISRYTIAPVTTATASLQADWNSMKRAP